MATLQYLRYSNAAVPGELLLDLFARVGIGQVRVKVLIQQLQRLLGEVAALPTRVEETERDVTSRYLRDGNAALAGQLLFRLLARVRVGQVRVEILVEDLRRLLAEVAAFATRVQETASGNTHIFVCLEAKVELVRAKCFVCCKNIFVTLI